LRVAGISDLFPTDAIIEAIYYAVDNGASIINASFGGYSYSQFQYDAWKYASDHNVLCIISAGNETNNNDEKPHYPASYKLPNIISVAATDEDDNLAPYSNYGKYSVHVAAPGGNEYISSDGTTYGNILSTYPDIKEGTSSTIYTEDFEGDFSEWKLGGQPQNWAVTIGTGVNGSNCLEDSPWENYPSNANTWIMSNTSFQRKKETKLLMGFFIKSYLEKNRDYLSVEISPNGITPWKPIPIFKIENDTSYMLDKIDENYTDFSPMLVYFTPFYEKFNWDSIYFRFHLITDGSNNYDGVYIDNISLFEVPLSVDTHTETYFSGTSMAAPVVAGIAGLVKSVRPWLSASQIKNIILSTVDVKPSLVDKVITGGRVNAYKAVTYNNPPNKPQNISPANNQSGVSLTPILTSSSYSDPEGDPHSSSHWIIKNSSDETVWEEVSSSALTSIQVPSGILTSGTTYYWQVRYQDNFGAWSDWSDPTSFTTNRSPLKPTNVSPPDGQTGVLLTPTLSASSFTDPDGDIHKSTQWQITNTKGDYSSSLWDWTSDTDLESVKVPSGALDYSTTYWWHVRYKDNYGNWSDWSDETSFTTIPFSYTLSITVNPSEAGNVIKNPDKTQFSPGEQVTLTAVANTGYKFTGWSGDETSTETSIVVTMDRNKNITANFSEFTFDMIPTLSQLSVILDENQQIETDITIDINSIGGFNNPVSFFSIITPAVDTITSSVEPDTVIPDGTSLLSLSISGDTRPDTYIVSRTYWRKRKYCKNKS